MIKPVEINTLVSETSRFFGDDTPLRQAAQVGGRPYEPRPQQRQMAERIAASFADGRHLCIEAPTGVGKTFAYLIPAILFAKQKDQPVVVTTHTIALQEQILDNDVPVLRALLKEEVRAVIAKGRHNYICLRRLHAAAGDHAEYLPSAELIPEVARLQRWAQTTADGSRSDLENEPDPALWDSVCCEVGNCLNGTCTFFRQCFLVKARQRLGDAHLIVANHAIFFSDLAMKTQAGTVDGGIIPAYAAVIVDEGHTMGETAAVHMGLRLTGFGLRRVLNRLYNNDRGRGLLKDAAFTEARMAVIDAADHAERFFRRVLKWLDKIGTDLQRCTTPGQLPDLLGPYLEKVEKMVAAVVSDEDDQGRQQELKSLVERVHEYRMGLQAFLIMNLDNHVYWIESQGDSRRGVAMCAVPVEVGPLLQNALFDQDFTVVVTSATLAVRDKLDYFRQQVGMQDANTAILDSPFNFAEQVTLYIPFDMPNPNETGKFVPAACTHIRRFLLETEGKAFVLFTSYRMMQDMAAELADFFSKSGLKLLVQGDGMPRSRMVAAFKEDINSVIFGTSSFWTGVDVPGEALSNVIITRLPFSVPDHPLIAAKNEAIERRGGKPFWDYTIPDAVLKFRQGFGRLIRSKTDKGIVVVLDNRIIRTSYGKIFLESVPKCRVQVF